MKRYIVGFSFGIAVLVSQTVRPPENLPWTRFHPATPPYQPTVAEKQQIQSKIDQLGGVIRELRSRRPDDALLPDVEIYYEAARWKMAYPEEFFRQRSVTDTLAVLDKGLERAAQLKEGKSPWTTQKGRVVRGYRSALDDSVQPVRVTVPDEWYITSVAAISADGKTIGGQAINLHRVAYVGWIATVP